MKKWYTLLLWLFLLTPLIGLCQTESHNFITYDTTWSLGPNEHWNMRISRPVYMFTPGSADTASRPAIITLPGQGEWDTTDYSTLQHYGPHYWLNHGWDGSVTLGNGKHYPILITLTYVDARTALPVFFHNILSAILSRYHIKKNSVHIGGFSQGAITTGGEIAYEASANDETGMKLVTSLVALQGEPQIDGTTAERALTCYKIWAKKYNGKYFTLEGNGYDNFRNTWKEADAMNDTVPGCAYFSYENLGGGDHCCWNEMWDPSATNWTCVGTLGPNNAPSQLGTNQMGNYQAPCNIFTWMLKQGDTSMVDTTGYVTLYTSPMSITGVAGIIGNAGTPQTVDVTFSSGLFISITAPTNTEISKDGGSTYASSQTLTSGSPVALKIRTTAAAPLGSISGNLTLSGTGVATVNVPVSGAVTNPPITPDSAKFQFLLTTSLLVPGWEGVIGDPSVAVRSGTISGTTITYSTVSTSSSNWGPFAGACIGANNGVTTAVIPDASNSGVMREAYNTANVFQTTDAQFVSGGWLTDGTTYDIEMSGTTQYAVGANGSYSVRGSSLSSTQSISGSGNTSSNATWSNITPDGSGNFTFYVGKSSSGQDVGMLSYIKIKKHVAVVAVTPDSARFQFLLTTSLLVPGWQGVIGDPSLAVRSGTISGTTITYSTVSTSSSNWGQFFGACIGANNGVTNATIPDASNNGVMREAYNTANVFQTTDAQFVSGGWLTDGTTYDIEMSGTTQYGVGANGSYSVRGSSLSSTQSISGSLNTSTNATWSNITPDGSGNFTFYVGKSSSGQDVGMLSYIKIRKHAAAALTPDSARFQFLITSSLLVPGWQGVIGDPSSSVISGTISGTTITYSTVSTSSGNWGQFSGACIGANNGVTNATIPDGSNNGVMKEAVLTANLYQTDNPQFVSGGWKTDGTTYDIELSGTTQYGVSAVGSYSVRGSTLSSSSSISGASNTSSKASWTNVAPDGSGNFTFYFGKNNSGEQVGLLSYIKIRKHETGGGGAMAAVGGNLVSVLYPNPTTGVFRVSFRSAVQEARVALLDVSGRVVQQRVVSGSQVDVDISSSPAGVYTLRVQQGMNVFTYKVVKL